ncbi:MAG TPA: substrate-binding domain-containing protein [Spirochaetia bacterium]|nr:substrate-binding domain-containing protein [Spirochaetia bacterium]
MVSARRPPRPRRVIGVLAAQLDDAYQIAVWGGIETRARQRGVGVVCFLGHRIGSPIESEAAANAAFRIADRRCIDGLIVVSSVIATFLDREGLEKLFASRAGMPQVSVGLQVPGVSSVTVDGSGGVASMVEHLALVHGKKSFALIEGPKGHAEAEQRTRTFRAALEGAGLPFDAQLAVEGTFLRDSGELAARRLLALRKPFDALVCMNDEMALGAMDVLRGAGIRVPEDVAVVGFDGIEEGEVVTPPLTTVIQPLGELGAAAADQLLELMETGNAKDRVLGCAPVFRQSCGCPPRRGYDQGLSKLPADATAAQRKAVAELTASARRGDADAFVAVLTAALSQTVLDGGRPGAWRAFLSVVRRSAAIPEDLFEFALQIVGEAEVRLQAARRVAAGERLATLRAISSSLAGAFEMTLMLSRLETGLARLGIGGCYLALFEPGDPPAAWSRLVMAPRPWGGSARALPARGIRFRTERLLPPRAGTSWRDAVWVLEPLVFQTEPLGYILLPLAVPEPAVYDTLRQQVSSALKGALLLDRVRSHERHLEAEVARRTAELTRTNRELTREIERRMGLEKEVLEISNRTMQRIGQDLHDDLCQHLAGIAMYASVLRGGLPAGDSAAVASIEQIGNLLADSIARAKQIARGLYPAGLEEHGLAAAVEELVETARRSYSAAIDLRVSPDFRLTDTDRALQVYRILQEALSNALKHSGSERVEVSLYRRAAGEGGSNGHGPAVVAEVTDYGSGLPALVSGDGMGLRIMRYRAATAGAELRIERLAPGTRVVCLLRGGDREA